MSTPTLPNAPFRTPVTDSNGLFTQAWVGWLTQLFFRAGGNIAPSLSSIGNSITTIQTTVTALAATVATLSASVATLTASVTTLSTTVTTQGTQIATLQNAVNGLNLEPMR